MGTWNNLQEGFTVNERLPDTLVDVAVWHVFNRAPQLYRQAPQIKKPPCVTLMCTPKVGNQLWGSFYD